MTEGYDEHGNPLVQGVVAGVVSAVGEGNLPGERMLHDRIEAAMTQAVKDALSEGISLDASDEIRARMLAARDAVVNGA